MQVEAGDSKRGPRGPTGGRGSREEGGGRGGGEGEGEGKESGAGPSERLGILPLWAEGGGDWAVAFAGAGTSTLASGVRVSASLLSFRDATRCVMVDVVGRLS